MDPNSAAAQQVAEWSTTRPADADQIRKIASQPQGKWISNGGTAIPAVDAQWLAARASANQTSLVVLYYIYNRDNGGLASGGAASPADYQAWIRSVAAAIGDKRVIVVLEPDALGHIPKLTASGQQTRFMLINDAVTVLKARPNTSVYIDAGNPYWISTAQMGPFLTQAGVAGANGFAINVANYAWTQDNLTYGDALSALVGGKHYVVDTGHNGLGPAPDYEWCNPPGRALGPRPTVSTGSPRCDAYAWITKPGYSNGACNGGPAWGWWPDHALGLCQRAAY